MDKKYFGRLAKLLVITAMLIVTASFAMAAATLTTPATGGVVIGSYLFNASCDDYLGNTSMEVYWIVWEAKSVSTANDSWTKIANSTTNYTSYQAAMEAAGGGDNATASTTGWEDANDYQVRATCYNATGVTIGTVSATTTGVILDNYAPTAPTSLSPAAGSTDTDGTVSFSATVNGFRTTACTLFLGSGREAFTMTHSGSTCTYSDMVLAEGSYVYVVEASDGRNMSETSLDAFNIDVKTSAGKAALMIAVAEEAEAEGKEVAISGATLSITEKTIGGVSFDMIGFVLIIIGIAIVLPFIPLPIPPPLGILVIIAGIVVIII